MQPKDSRTTGFISQESKKVTVPSFWLNTTVLSLCNGQEFEATQEW